MKSTSPIHPLMMSLLFTALSAPAHGAEAPSSGGAEILSIETESSIKLVPRGKDAVDIIVCLNDPETIPAKTGGIEKCQPLAVNLTAAAFLLKFDEYFLIQKKELSRIMADPQGSEPVLEMVDAKHASLTKVLRTADEGYAGTLAYDIGPCPQVCNCSWRESELIWTRSIRSEGESKSYLIKERDLPQSLSACLQNHERGAAASRVGASQMFGEMLGLAKKGGVAPVPEEAFTGYLKALRSVINPPSLFASAQYNQLEYRSTRDRCRNDLKAAITKLTGALADKTFKPDVHAKREFEGVLSSLTPERFDYSVSLSSCRKALSFLSEAVIRNRDFSRETNDPVAAKRHNDLADIFEAAVPDGFTPNGLAPKGKMPAASLPSATKTPSASNPNGV